VQPARPWELTRTGVVFSRGITQPEYEALGVRLAGIANATAWAIGDWILAGVSLTEYGNRYEHAMSLTGRSYDSLSQYCRVSASYGHDERGLGPWSLYREALRLSTHDRIRALELARDNGWNRNGLVDYINTRLETKNALNGGAHQSAALTKRVGRRQWRTASAPKQRVRCPHCGELFDVRRKGVTEEPITTVGR